MIMMWRIDVQPFIRVPKPGGVDDIIKEDNKSVSFVRVWRMLDQQIWVFNKASRETSIRANIPTPWWRLQSGNEDSRGDD